MKPLAILAVMIALISIPAFGQAPPCPSGTLANVLGTSCSVGNLTFGFQNNFNGSIVLQDISGVHTVPLPSNAIGFTPIQSGNQTGFLLTTNFADNNNGVGLSFSQHNASFSYSIQVNGAFEILGENAQAVGGIGDLTPSSSDALFAFDGRCFTNGLCLSVQPRIAFDPKNGAFDQPSVSATLGLPGVASPGQGAPFTTEVDSFAIGGGDATLTSVQFLYTVVPQAPLPPPARLRYKNIDLPGQQSTSVGAINNHAQIAGAFTDFSGVTHGYVSDGDRVTTVDFPGAASTLLNGINDQADVVGQYTDGAGVTHGFARTDGSFSTIDFPGSILNVAGGINDRGQIVGAFQNADRSIHGYLFQDGNFTVIDDPDAFVFHIKGNPVINTQMLGINNRGESVGISTNQFNRFQGFLLDDGVFHRIAAPGVVATATFGLNDHDQVVGFFRDVNLNVRGFLLTHDIFNTVDFPGSVITQAFVINSRDQIVGVYTDDTGAAHSFLAERKDDPGDEASATTSSTSAPISGAATLNATPSINPCAIRRPLRPDPATGLLACGQR